MCDPVKLQETQPLDPNKGKAPGHTPIPTPKATLLCDPWACCVPSRTYE